MPGAGNTIFQLRLPPDLVTWLHKRAERAGQVPQIATRCRAELELWRDHLAAELSRVHVTLAEINCLADVMGPHYTLEGVGYPVRFATENALWGGDHRGLAEKWGVDPGQLLARLHPLGPTADHALADAIGQWWEMGCAPTAEGWADVFIRVV